MMSSHDELFRGSSLRCTISLEPLPTVNGVGGKSERSQSAELIIGRNQFEEPVLRVHLGKVVRIFSLDNIAIHRRFLKDGKSTLTLSADKVQLLLSNCPPEALLSFLRTLVAKLAKQKRDKTNKISNRQRLFNTGSSSSFTEISPLCAEDLESVRTTAKQGETTPVSSKRKYEIAGPDKENVKQDKRQRVRRSIAVTTGLSELHPKQLRVLQAIMSGQNVFFTGSAGTGKSYLLRRTLGSLAPEHTFVTASTGIAASHISGMTLHSFAGIGSGKADLSQCVSLASRTTVAAQWKRCRHLIIDEISMVSGELFAKLEAVARVVRKSEQPFGGIQLIVCGDFFQLPPVERDSEAKKECMKFAFQSKAWRKCIDTTIQLEEVKRQTDSDFIELLNKVRKGYCSPDIVRTLKSTVRNKLDNDGFEATNLSTHNDDVESINTMSLQRISGESKLFCAIDSDPSLSKQISEVCPVAREITLKIGAQVLVCKNISMKDSLVNGTRGVVVGFDKSRDGAPIIRTVNGKKWTIKPETFTSKLSGGLTLKRRQIPLKLAWAISIHKSQGMTLDLVQVSLSRVFEYGQAYVALSRARSLQGLRILDFCSESVRAHPHVKEFYASLEASTG